MATSIPESVSPVASGEGLAARSLSALKWNYLGATARIVSQLVVGVVLARLLGPEPFGVLAMCWIVIGLGNLLADSGFAAALVQRLEVTADDVRHVFTVQMAISVLLTVCVALAAPLVAGFYGRPETTAVLRVLSLYFVVQSLGQVSSSLLKRRLDFKALQTAQVVSYLIAYLGGGVGLALAGFGVWSLVAAALLQGAVAAVLLFRAHPHSMAPRWRTQDGGFLTFGLKVLGGNLSNYAIGNTDSVVIGRAFGVAELGLYNRSMQLLMTPMNAVLVNLMSVLMPAYAQGQNDLTAVRHAYLASLTVVALLCLPPVLAAGAVAKTVVVGLYGLQWQAAAVLLPPVAAATIATALLALAGPVLVGTGHPGAEFRAQFLAAILMVGAMIWASTQSLVVLAWTVPIVLLGRFFLITHAALRICQGTWRHVLGALAGPTLIGVATACAVALADRLMLPDDLADSGRLLTDIVVGLAAYVGFAHAFVRTYTTPSVHWLLQRLGHRVPARIRSRLLRSDER